MNTNITINNLSPGEIAVVDDTESSPLSKRLHDLGLTSGTKIRCLHRAPLGDPTAFEIRGAVIALRCEDSRLVHAHRGECFHG